MTKHVFRTMMLLLACSTMIFAGCKKDDDDSSDNGGGGNGGGTISYEGVFNPSQKISKIYYGDEYNGKYLTQKFEWDADNHLYKIIYYSSNGTTSGTVNFTYNSNNQIIKVTEDNDTYIEIQYDGNNQLKKIINGEDAEMTVTERQNGRIHKIILVNYDKSSSLSGNRHIWNFFFPEQIAEKIGRAAFDANEESETIIMTWNGNNIIKYELSSGTYYKYYTFTYDNKSNPFYGSMIDFLAYDFSENNVTKEDTYKGSGVSHKLFEYDYDSNGFPTIKKEYEDNSYQCTYYYEYQ